MKHNANDTTQSIEPNRRVFKNQCGVIFLSGIAGASLVPIVSAAVSYSSDFIETNIAAPENLISDRKILVAYASMYGSTSGTALAIGEEFARLGHAVDVRVVPHADNLPLILPSSSEVQ